MTSQKRGAQIDRLSLCAVRLYVKAEGGAKIADATGFIVDSTSGPLLLTARHCLTGRHHYTGELLDKRNAGVPHKILALHHLLNPQAGVWSEIDLYDENGTPRWIQHPLYGCLADIAAVPVCPPEKDETIFVPIDDEAIHFRRAVPDSLQGSKFQLLPSDMVSVIGFPFGLSTASSLPLWATGFIASEPNILTDFGTTYIDCRARQGQSGAPVFVKRSGETILDDGQHILFDGEAHSFFGLYVGRISAESDLGIVYRSKTIRELIEHGNAGHDCYMTKTKNCRDRKSESV